MHLYVRGLRLDPAAFTPSTVLGVTQIVINDGSFIPDAGDIFIADYRVAS